jgi:mannose-1-phosphate guanylyltransferase
MEPQSSSPSNPGNPFDPDHRGALDCSHDGRPDDRPLLPPRRTDLLIGRREADKDAWAIVLAGGRGERLATVVRERCGHDLPKQFAALYGGSSFLQRTLSRIAPIFLPERTVVVVAGEHLNVARAQTKPFGDVRLVGQPDRRGTAAGLLLPLAHVLQLAADPLVAVFPCDHHVRNRRRFIDSIVSGLAFSRLSPGGVALVGAHGLAPNPALGWIVPGPRTGYAGRPVWSVAQFVEKPSAEVARGLAAAGAFWNTLVITARGRALWNLLERRVPEVASRLQLYRSEMDGPDAAGLLYEIYRSIPERDLSRDVLEGATGDLDVLAMEGAGWLDCGTPEGLCAAMKHETEH